MFEIKNSKDKISFSGKFKKNIDIRSNTVTKVLNLLRKNNFLKNKYFKINIQKNIHTDLVWGEHLPMLQIY